MLMCMQCNIMKHRFRVAIHELEKYRSSNIENFHCHNDKDFKRLDEKLLTECIRYHLAIFELNYISFFKII